MQECPQCHGTNYRKNGRVQGRQRYLCKDCGRQFLEQKSVTKSSFGLPEKSEAAMSIILLDLENLKLDALAEKFLQNLATYPLQVKLAFANWSEKGVNKQDIELYERGYFLVHVPGGKNSADARMMTLGAAIRVHYPRVEEVFVCSSDWLLTNLSNELLSQNLKVWRVRRQNKLLEIEDRKTGEVHAYSLDLNQEVPEPKQLVAKLEKLIEQEQQSISDKIQELSQLEELLTTRKELLKKTQSNSQNNGKGLEIKAILQKPNAESNGKVPVSKSDILCEEDLESAIAQIIEDIQVNSPNQKINPSTISNGFKKKFKVTANQVIKDLKAGSNITDFLQKKPHLMANATQNQPTSTKAAKKQKNVSSSLIYPIKTRDQLREVLFNLVESFLKKHSKTSMPVTSLGASFKEYYGESVSTVMKAVKVTGNFTKFLDSCEEFTLKKLGKTEHIVINN